MNHHEILNINDACSKLLTRILRILRCIPFCIEFTQFSDLPIFEHTGTSVDTATCVYSPHAESGSGSARKAV